LIDQIETLANLEDSHGHAYMGFPRAEFLRLLHRTLPDKETRILTNKAVAKIDCHADGVKVCCQDGTMVEGSIVIGCDGVHSTVRGFMRELALQATGKDPDGPHPMKQTYRGLVGRAPLLEGLEVGDTWEVHGRGTSLQLMNGARFAFFIVYDELPQPAVTDRSAPPYTDEDAEALAARVADWAATRDMKFGQVWAARSWSRMVNLEEGFLKRWHWDRIVLVGDSHIKLTPNVGLSLNTAWQGGAELANRLRKLLLPLRDHGATDPTRPPPPSTAAIDGVFSAYQKARMRPNRIIAFISALHTRKTAWKTPGLRFLDWLEPYLGGDEAQLTLLVSPILRRGVVLDFVPEPGFKDGKVKWLRRNLEAKETTQGRSD